MPLQTRASKKRKKVETIIEVVIDVPKKGERAAKKHIAYLIDKLPNEILAEIFTYLPWSQRGEYMSVCKHWRTVMIESPVLWKHPPTITGTFGEIFSKMIVLRERSGNGLRSLSLSVLPDNTKIRRGENTFYHVTTVSNSGRTIGRTVTRLHQVFPSATLERFRYTHEEGAFECVDNEIWNCVLSCERLKALNWSTDILQRHEHDSEVTIWVEKKPLAKCMLEEFILDIGYVPEIDDAFINTISKVKRLHLNGRVGMSDLAKIFDRVKDAVEDLEFTNLFETYVEYDDMPTWDELKRLEGNQPIIHMPLLKRFCASFLYEEPCGRYPLPTPYRIIAPNVTNLSFQSVPAVDWVLLESCRSTLKSFHFDAHADKLHPRLVEELFNMPELEELRFESSFDNSDYRSEYNGTYFFTSFWKAIETGNTNNPNVAMVDILPKLKRLTIIDDPQLTYEKMSKLLDLIPIEELRIWFWVKAPFTATQIATLKRRVPTLEIRYEGEWDYPDTKWAYKQHIQSLSQPKT